MNIPFGDVTFIKDSELAVKLTAEASREGNYVSDVYGINDEVLPYFLQ